MPESPQKDSDVQPTRKAGFPTPWGYLRRRRDERFQRQRDELLAYLRAATPFALQADRLYQAWRESVSEPVQDSQKAANLSAVYWWQVTDRLRAFDRIAPPQPAKRYHKRFGEALGSASLGAEIAKNGFRSNKFSEVSRGLGFLDRYLELMAEAEAELRRLVKKYRLIEGEQT